MSIAMPAKIQLATFAFAILALQQFLCGAGVAPSRIVPTSTITIQIIDMPAVLHKGDVASFVIQTTPYSSCLATIGYPNQIGKLTWMDLPQIESDETGQCSWEWTVPSDAFMGEANLRVVVEKDGQSKDLLPQLFQIED